jgi:hypothetical protein
MYKFNAFHDNFHDPNSTTTLTFPSPFSLFTPNSLLFSVAVFLMSPFNKNYYFLCFQIILINILILKIIFKNKKILF